MDARRLLFALTIGAAALAAGGDAALAARGAGKRKPETIELTRPARARDADASGTVRITRGAKGDRTTIDLARLDPKTRYEVRDGATGDLLGAVRTNRRGRASFNLTRSLAKSASARGSDARDVANVDIVDPATGEPVLTGDVTPEPVVPRFGYANYANEAGDSADVFMSSDPDNGFESFSLEFFPVADPDATTFTYHDLLLDAANGDALPLGVASVADLAGRRFEIAAPDGTAVIGDNLPELDPLDCPVFDDPWGDDLGGWDDGWNGAWDDGWSSGGLGDWGSWTSDPPASDPNGFPGGARGGHAKRAGGVRDVPAGYTLRIADSEGVLQFVARLTEHTVDVPADCPFGGYDDAYGAGDWGDFGGGVIGIVFFAPFDGSFDWSDLFGDLSGGWDRGGSAGDGTFDPAGSAARGRHRGR